MSLGLARRAVVAVRRVVVALGVSDTFTRADSATTLGTAESGQPWVATKGTWGVAANQAYCVSAADDDAVVVDVGSANMTVTATMSALGNNGILGRDDGTSTGARYLLNPQSSQTLLYSRTAGGGYTQIASAAAAAAGDVYALTCTGTAITVKKNGTQVISVTDSAVTVGTRAGLRQGGSAATPRYDNFTAA